MLLHLQGFFVILLYIKMKTKEIKTEIHKVIDRIPENVLQDILDYLKQLEDISQTKRELSKNLKLILTEDKELLDKLAH